MMPAVGILVGSGSDLPTMEKCTKRLEDLGVEHELEVLSAHRNPEAVAEYVAAAPERGINVFICAAGMAAHLAGAVAARTNLPVIGVPIAAGTLGGFDALLATVQMPTGVPVATVAVNGAANAAVLAAQILALGDSELAKRLEG
ncbi:MAG: 5-(carboxyamino)imidazole ribonucleotide mutase [Actinomycetota bacterium]|nr:5-(carboxyamino)imidazole ribonucleotide mutase [Rubrobacter sp.]MDQ3237035.1 5-(carboxyamino)imidazole ribonucleotide mutase [Actinomycetota bacterium]MDQ3567867.1 5-(carboxyamino)imidazole ribonucleotide mutase [Actinomycetota bacterium]